MLAPTPPTSQNSASTSRRFLELPVFINELRRIITAFLDVSELSDEGRQSLLAIQRQIEQEFVPRSENTDEFLSYLSKTFDQPTPFQQELRSFLCRTVSLAKTPLAEKEIIFTPPDFNAIWLFMLRERIVEALGPDDHKFEGIYRSFRKESEGLNHLLVIQNNLSEFKTVFLTLHEAFHSKQKPRSQARMIDDPLFVVLIEGFIESLTLGVLSSCLDIQNQSDPFLQEIPVIVNNEYNHLLESGKIIEHANALSGQEKLSEIIFTPFYNTYMAEYLLVDEILHRVQDHGIFIDLLVSGNIATLRHRLGHDRFDVMKSFLKTWKNSHLFTKLPKRTALGILRQAIVAPDNFDRNMRDRFLEFTEELKNHLFRFDLKADQHGNLALLARQYVIEGLERDSLVSALTNITSVPPDVVAMIRRALTDTRQERALEEAL